SVLTTPPPGIRIASCGRDRREPATDQLGPPIAAGGTAGRLALAGGRVEGTAAAELRWRALGRVDGARHPWGCQRAIVPACPRRGDACGDSARGRSRRGV